MNKNFYHLFITLLFTIIYRLGSFTKITFGDAMSIVLDTERGQFTFETFSTTHFLYSNFKIAVHKILPFLDAIEIVRWLSIISAVIVLNILFIIIRRITSNDWISLIGVFVFGFSFTFWKNTENIEVYTFSLIWISLYCYFAIVFLQSKSNKMLLYSGIVLGLSFSCHIQGFLLIPSYLYLCYVAFSKGNSKVLAYSFLPILFILLLYIYPLANNLPIKNVFSSTNSSWVSDSLEKSILGYLKDFVQSLAYIIYNFWGFSIFLFFIPLKKFIKDQILLFLVIFGLPVFGFATIYAVSDNYIFFLNFNFSYLIILCVGLSYFINRFSKYQFIISCLVFITPLYYLAAKEIALQTEVGKKFHQAKLYKDGLTYYLLPWMNGNKGLLETLINEENIPDNIIWMEEASEEYIKIKSKTMTIEEIKEL